MTPQPPRRALALIERWVPDSEPLIGDLVEEFERRRSPLWLWRQALWAVAMARLQPTIEIRPLHLVDAQPLDAIARTQEWLRRPRDVSPTPKSFPAGLGLIVLGGVVTAVAPTLWLALLSSIIAGVAFGVLLFKRRQHQPPPAMTRRLA